MAVIRSIAVLTVEHQYDDAVTPEQISEEIEGDIKDILDSEDKLLDLRVISVIVPQGE